MARRKMTTGQVKKAKRLAEKLKAKPGVKNPHALARYQVRHPRKKK